VAFNGDLDTENDARERVTSADSIDALLTLMSVPDEAMPVSQQRSEPRRWLLRTGRLTPDDGGFSLRCTIIDISDHGARVSVEQRVNLPTTFFLIDTLDRVAFRTCLVWSNAPEHGLRLLERIELKRSEATDA
jgi:hypothetical protein